MTWKEDQTKHTHRYLRTYDPARPYSIITDSRDGCHGQYLSYKPLLRASFLSNVHLNCKYFNVCQTVSVASGRTQEKLWK
jgi:hypothetical protein